MTEVTVPAVVGIQFSKRKVNVALIAGGKTKIKAAERTREGITELCTWIGRQKVDIGQVHACVGATGQDAELLGIGLHHDGINHIAFAEPAAVEEFVRSEEPDGKADPRAVARYYLATRPPLWQIPPREVRVLLNLCEGIETLKGYRALEAERLDGYDGQLESVADSLRDHIAFLDRSIKETERSLDEWLAANPQLKDDAELMARVAAARTKN